MSTTMTDRELLEALNLEHPGLEQVRAAVMADDLDAGKEQLIEYFRQRKVETDASPPVPEDHPEATTERAEELCRLLASKDWLSVPDPGAIPERLYSTQVMMQNDHGEFFELAQAYVETGNHRYARECVSLMLQWVDVTGPLPNGPPIGPTAPMWRTIEYVNPRISNWTKCLALLGHCPAVSVDEQITLLKVILHHLRYVGNNQVPGMPNMVIHLFEKLIGSGRAWPEFAESSQWIATGVDGLYTLLDDYFYPDGAYIELSYFAHECFTRTAALGER